MQWYEDFTLTLISVTVKVNIYILSVTFINSIVYCFYNFLTTCVIFDWQQDHWEGSDPGNTYVKSAGKLWILSCRSRPETGTVWCYIYS